MKEFKPTWLYLKVHNTTGLKYFGKTVRNPYDYFGSGIRWNRHLKKHGYDITTVWTKLFINSEELRDYAIKFSHDNNIVESKEYANLMIEDGFTGGDTGITEEGRKIISEQSKNRRHSEQTKQKIREKRAEQIDPRLGKKHSDETKQKIKEKRKNQIMPTGKKMSDETRAKIFTKERSNKISMANKGRKFSEEHRKKLSEAANSRHVNAKRDSNVAS
jgi:hypothetical protein